MFFGAAKKPHHYTRSPPKSRIHSPRVSYDALIVSTSFATHIFKPGD
jgi:hypothetical protein